MRLLDLDPQCRNHLKLGKFLENLLFFQEFGTGIAVILKEISDFTDKILEKGGHVNALTADQGGIEPKVNRLPMKVEAPTFFWKQDKWSTTRNKNVEAIAHEWKACPGLVRVFTDRKFGRDSMVMLRKKDFEHTLKVLHDVQHGEVMLRTNLETLFDHVKMVTILFEQTHKTVSKDEEPMALAIKALTRITGQIQSVFHYVADPKPIGPAALSSDEEEQLRQLEEND